MTLVVDASVALKWVLEEPDSHLAQALTEGEEEVLVPDFWLNEAANVCWLQVRKGKWSADEAREGLALLRALVPPTATSDLDLHDVALDIGLAGLPHREHPAGEDWLIATDYAQLLVRPGVRVLDDGSRESLAVPSGTIARLLLIDLQSEALEKGSRDIELGSNPNLLLNRLGLSRGGPVSRKVVDQLERICRLTLDFKIGNDRRAIIVNERIVEAFEYTTHEDPRTKRRTPMVERLRLS